MTSVEEQQPIIDQITQALVDRLSHHHNIAIILMYGSRSPKKSTAHPASDVEYIAIMDDTEENSKFDIQFCYQRIPADLWSTSWKWIDEIAERKVLTIVAATSYILGDVVYSRSAADTKRFEAVVTKLKNSEKYRDTYLDLARENYWGIREQLGPLLLARKYHDLEYAREHISNIYVGTAILLGRINQHLYIDNWGRNLRETFQLEIKPQGLQEKLDQLASSTDYDEIIEVATEVVDSLRLIMIQVQKGREEKIVYDFIETDEDTALSYLGKFQKAAAEEDIFGIIYAYNDFIREYKLDLIKQAGLWDKSMIFKLPHEHPKLDEKQHIPDFMEAISLRDFDLIDKMAAEMDQYLRQNMSLEAFDNEEKMQAYIATRYDEIFSNIDRD